MNIAPCYHSLRCCWQIRCWKNGHVHLCRRGASGVQADNSAEMAEAVQLLLKIPDKPREIAGHGLATIRRRHTIAHRVDELLTICSTQGLPGHARPASPWTLHPSQEVTE